MRLESSTIILLLGLMAQMVSISDAVLILAIRHKIVLHNCNVRSRAGQLLDDHSTVLLDLHAGADVGATVLLSRGPIINHAIAQ